MYSEKFVEELLEMVGRLANENKQLQKLVNTQDGYIAKLRGDPVIALASRMPAYPSKGTSDDQKVWWQTWRELFDYLKAAEHSVGPTTSSGVDLTAIIDKVEGESLA